MSVLISRAKVNVRVTVMRKRGMETFCLFAKLTPANSESGEQADEGAHRRGRVWRTGGRRLSYPERGGTRAGHHDLRGRRADGWWLFFGRQCAKRLQPPR